MSYDDWSREEVDATVADYFDMLDQGLRGNDYNKSAHRRRLSTRLNARSDAAIERKHQNISAILIELGFVYIAGYKPLRNYQRLLYESVSSRLAGSHALTDYVHAQVSAPATVPQVDDILNALVDPPAPDPDQARYSTRLRERPTVQKEVDYLAIEASNRSLGAAGEVFVVRFEIERLRRAGCTALAAKVERVTETQGDGLGFDVLSFETSGQERFIEVKTTAYGALTPFFVSRNEVAVSRVRGDRFHLYRAFQFRNEPQLFFKKGSLDQAFNLDPYQYEAMVY